MANQRGSNRIPMRTTLLTGMIFTIITCSRGYRSKDYLKVNYGNLWGYKDKTETIVIDFGVVVENNRKEWLEAVIRVSTNTTVPFRLSYKGDDVVIMLPYDFNTKDLIPFSLATILKSPVRIGRRFKVMDTDSGPVMGEYVSKFVWSSKLNFPEEVGVRYYHLPTRSKIDTIEVIFRFTEPPTRIMLKQKGKTRLYSLSVSD